MALNIIVCDDSSFARKQLIRSIPKSIVNDLYQAGNGIEAMKLLREQKVDLLFLDLTMPIMDGYQVLEAIHAENIDVLVIVISGDVQEQAKQITSHYNILEFVNKPLKSEKLHEILLKFGLCEEEDLNSVATENNQLVEESSNTGITENRFDELAEKVNIATGVAAAKMADIMNLFITMPVPEIKISSGKEVYDVLYGSIEINNDIGISQGFVGNNILGEVVLLMTQKDIQAYHTLISDSPITEKSLRYVAIELGGLISGSIMRSFATQFNTVINLTHPALIQQLSNNNLCENNGSENHILSVHLDYKVKTIEMNIDCYLLFTNKTSSTLNSIMAFV